MNEDREATLDPREDAEAEALRAWLAGERAGAPGDEVVRAARRAAAAEALADAPRATRVAERVLAELRADRPARGPVGLVGRARASLERSVALRVVAASLLVHLLALPAVAWWWLAPDPVPDYVITFEPAPEAEAGPVDAGGPADAAPTTPPAAAAALAAVEARRLDRYRLDRAVRPVLPDGAASTDARGAEYWFAWRVRALDRPERFTPFDLTRPLDGPLALSAQLEAALDRALRAPDDALARALVDRRLADLEALGARGTGLERALLERARARARRYGLAAEAAPAGTGTTGEPDPTPRGWLESARPLLEQRPAWRATLAESDADRPR